jgi:uncharacterized protein YxjI
MSELLTRNILVINQKAKLIELSGEFRILDEEGNQIGVIREEGQSKAKKLLRMVSNIDSVMTHRLSVFDSTGAKVVQFVRPRAILKSTVEVSDGSGRLIGRMKQKNLLGKRRFGLEDANGNDIGSINSENWRAWNFSIQDASEHEVGRITKSWAGVLKEAFTTADNYVLQITGQVSPDLRLMILASAAGIDIAIKQAEG